VSIIDEARRKVAAACTIDGSSEPLALVVGDMTWTRMRHEVESMMTVNVTPTGDTFMGLPVEFSDEPDHLSVRVSGQPDGKAETERFFRLPEGSLREMKPGEKLTYERRFPLPPLAEKPEGGA